MKIFVNNQEIEIFNGARVEDAVRKFDKKLLRKVKSGGAETLDSYGNHIAISAPLYENSQITITQITKQK